MRWARSRSTCRTRIRSTCTTPNQRNLFSDDYRFNSPGCSRVDNVRDLAAWLLKDLPHWNRAAIDAAIATGQRQDIHFCRRKFRWPGSI